MGHGGGGGGGGISRNRLGGDGLGIGNKEFLLLFDSLNKGLSGRVKKTGSDKDQEIPLGPLVGGTSEEGTNKGCISKDRCLILHFLDILTHEPPQNHGLPIIDGDLCVHLPDAEDGLVDGVRSEDKCLGAEC